MKSFTLQSQPKMLSDAGSQFNDLPTAAVGTKVMTILPIAIDVFGPPAVVAMIGFVSVPDYGRLQRLTKSSAGGSSRRRTATVSVDGAAVRRDTIRAG